MSNKEYIDEGKTLTEQDALEQGRRLSQAVVSSVNSMINKFLTDAPDGVVPWGTLQLSNEDLARNLQALQRFLTDEATGPWLRASHPTLAASFNAFASINAVESMFRKKLEFNSQDWYDSAQKHAARLDSEQQDSTSVSKEAFHELWQWTPVNVNSVFADAVQAAEEAQEEEEDEDEDEDEEGDKSMQDVGTQQTPARLRHQPSNPSIPMLGLTQVLPFMLTGQMPPAPRPVAGGPMTGMPRPQR